MQRLIIWGAGELGLRVAVWWRYIGGETVGFTKTTKRHDQLRQLYVQAHTGAPTEMLADDDALLLAIPGHTNQHEAVKQLVAAGTPVPARAVFISVTGYYGLPRAGLRLIDETTPVGEDARAHSVAAAETAFRTWAGDNGVILRAGGLYSETRGPMNILAKRGYPKSGPPNKTMALIHYDDLAEATFNALQQPKPAPVYVAVMPPCPTRETFYTIACEKLGLPAPEFEPPLPHPPIEYDATRLRRDLLPNPKYPDWRSALTPPQADDEPETT